MTDLALCPGVFLGDWESGPWLGWRTRARAPGSYGWAGLGWSGTAHHGAWRHVCIALDFKTGHLAAYEGGRQYYEGKVEDLVKVFNSLDSTISIFTVGCVYKMGTTPFMSLHGKVTDFQVWSKILSQDKLEKITSCRHFESGNILRLSQVTRIHILRSGGENRDL